MRLGEGTPVQQRPIVAGEQASGRDRFRSPPPVPQRPIVAVEQRPVRDRFSSPRALEYRTEFGPGFAPMPVAQLVERAAVFIEDPMIGMDQNEENGAPGKLPPPRSS